MSDPVRLQFLTRNPDGSAFEIFEADSTAAHSAVKPQKPPAAEWELRQQPLGIDGRRHFVLKNLREDRYLLLNSQEHFLWQAFDGYSSLEEIARAFHLEYGAFDYSLIREFLGKLHNAGLIHGDRTLGSPSDFVSPQHSSSMVRRVRRAADACRHFTLRIPQADRYCSLLYRRGGFALFHPASFWMIVALAIAGGFACFQLAGQAADFTRLLYRQPYSSAAIVLAALLGASILHALVHALACKAHGRRVREMGFFMLQGVLPTFYADVTDIFMSDRRARLTVDLAGPMVEVFFGSVAILAAYSSSPGLGQALLFATGVLLWESALINLYPFSFLEMDGYNMLADAIAMPMLRRQSLALLPHLAQRLRQIRTIERAEIIQIGYLALCFASVAVYVVLHLDALAALLPFSRH